MGKRVLGNSMLFWEKSIPVLLDLLEALGYVWGHVAIYKDSPEHLKHEHSKSHGYSKIMWEEGTLDLYVHREKTMRVLHHPKKLNDRCVLLRDVDSDIFPYKPPILSQILVPGDVADKIFDILVKYTGLKIEVIQLEEVTGEPGFEAWLGEIEADSQNSVVCSDSMLPDDDERIKLLRIYITAARACPRSSAPARRSGRAAGRRCGRSARSRIRGTSATGCGSRRACRRR
jgi:hypothetical protein